MAQGVHQAVKSTKLGAGKGRISHAKKHTVHRRHNGGNILLKSQMKFDNQKNAREVTYVSKKSGQTTIVVQYYSLSSFL